MEFEQDYIMRMIKGETAALARIIFRKTSPQYELPEEINIRQWMICLPVL